MDATWRQHPAPPLCSDLNWQGASWLIRSETLLVSLLTVRAGSLITLVTLDGTQQKLITVPACYTPVVIG